MDTLSLSNHVNATALAKAPTIKNRGCLNPAFFYFDATTGDLVTGSNASLSDSSPNKYFTVAADMIVFNPTRTHVLMIFRCPHDRKEGKTCKNNILDKGSFQYKGCLATPGGFFDSREDMVNGIPDFQNSALRELNEECSNLLADEGKAVQTASETKAPLFVSAEFNNYRDVRWFTSTNYVPCLATQFTVALPRASGHCSDLPRIIGSDDACGNAYWVDVRIINAVYESHKQIYSLFEDHVEWDETKFEEYIASAFIVDSETKLPRNKLKSENTLLCGMDSKEFVVDFVEGTEYQFSDFAFDHVRNIVRAQKALETDTPASQAAGESHHRHAHVE
ncbi:hypothetical protein HDU98_001036 [Podochytrium sp. JEL0797]|nr:hypothetical protein HDU98_001036 [Podochytrium sp. JEL0797]